MGVRVSKIKEVYKWTFFSRLLLTRSRSTLWQLTLRLFPRKSKHRRTRTFWKVTLSFSNSATCFWKQESYFNHWSYYKLQESSITSKQSTYHYIPDIVDMRQRQKCLDLASNAGLYISFLEALFDSGARVHPCNHATDKVTARAFW